MAGAVLIGLRVGSFSSLERHTLEMVREMGVKRLDRSFAQIIDKQEAILITTRAATEKITSIFYHKRKNRYFTIKGVSIFQHIMKIDFTIKRT